MNEHGGCVDVVNVIDEVNAMDGMDATEEPGAEEKDK